jgi:hypothetical protein
LLLGVLLLASGCSSSSGTPKVKVGDTNPKRDDTESGPAGAPAPQEFVGTFIKALGEGKATADMLTPAFRRQIARPRPGNEEDKQLGYNPIEVESFLRKAGEGRFEIGRAGAPGPGPFFYGNVTSAAGVKQVYLIRLAQIEGAWRIGWFHRTSAVGPAYDEGNPGPALLGAALTAHQFLENLIGGDLRLAEAVLAKSWKVREYESKTPSDVDLGYNQALVQQRLRGWKNNFASFTITKRDFAAGKPVTFAGDLMDGAKKEKRTFTMKVGQGEGGEWFVEEFEVK